jgi:V/A-type H+/Na+-transporting ATPase subunit C
LTDDFSYLNARIKIRRSRLLNEGFFHEALQLSFSELVKILGETEYGQDLTGQTLADVDHAISVHLSRTLTDLPRLVSGEAQEPVKLVLLRSDLKNIKLILRGKRTGKPSHEIAPLLGGGTLPRSIYEALAEAPDAAAMAQLLTFPGHPLARALREACATTREPIEMEIALDRTFYAAMLRRARELDQPYLSHFITAQIDVLNLATGLKLHEMGLQIRLDRAFLQGGKVIHLPLFERLAKGDVAALEELGDTDFKMVAEARELARIEHQLRCILLAEASAGAKDELGIGIVVDYVQKKEWEAARLRLLARRANYGLPASSVEQEVFCQ